MHNVYRKYVFLYTNDNSNSSEKTPWFSAGFGSAPCPSFRGQSENASTANSAGEETCHGCGWIGGLTPMFFWGWKELEPFLPALELWEWFIYIYIYIYTTYIYIYIYICIWWTWGMVPMALFYLHMASNKMEIEHDITEKWCLIWWDVLRKSYCIGYHVVPPGKQT